MFIWIEKTDKPTRLTVQQSANRNNTQYKNTSSSSQTLQEKSYLKSFSNHEKKSTKNHSSKRQHSRGPPMGHRKINKDLFQVHSEIVWGVPMDESHSPSRRSPSRYSEGDQRGRPDRKPPDHYHIRLK